MPVVEVVEFSNLEHPELVGLVVEVMAALQIQTAQMELPIEAVVVAGHPQLVRQQNLAATAALALSSLKYLTT
jgi:hypothetical protein